MPFEKSKLGLDISSYYRVFKFTLKDYMIIDSSYQIAYKMKFSFKVANFSNEPNFLLLYQRKKALLSDPTPQLIEFRLNFLATNKLKVSMFKLNSPHGTPQEGSLTGSISGLEVVFILRIRMGYVFSKVRDFWRYDLSTNKILGLSERVDKPGWDLNLLDDFPQYSRDDIHFFGNQNKVFSLNFTIFYNEIFVGNHRDDFELTSELFPYLQLKNVNDFDLVRKTGVDFSEPLFDSNLVQSNLGYGVNFCKNFVQSTTDCSNCYFDRILVDQKCKLVTCTSGLKDYQRDTCIESSQLRYFQDLNELSVKELSSLTQGRFDLILQKKDTPSQYVILNFLAYNLDLQIFDKIALEYTLSEYNQILYKASSVSDGSPQNYQITLFCEEGTFITFDNENGSYFCVTSCTGNTFTAVSSQLCHPKMFKCATQTKFGICDVCESGNDLIEGMCYGVEFPSFVEHQLICSQPQFKIENNTCILNQTNEVPNCKIQNLEVCLLCDSGYTMISQVCTPDCSLDSGCHSCSPSLPYLCDKCLDTHYEFEDQCLLKTVKCTDLDPNALLCDQNLPGETVECVSNFTLDPITKICKPDQGQVVVIPNCQTYNSNSECIVCDNNFLLALNGQCIQADCSSNEIQQCKSNFNQSCLIHETCLDYNVWYTYECSNMLPNCKVCSSIRYVNAFETQCISCEESYQKGDDGVCQESSTEPKVEIDDECLDPEFYQAQFEANQENNQEENKCSKYDTESCGINCQLCLGGNCVSCDNDFILQEDKINCFLELTSNAIQNPVTSQYLEIAMQLNAMDQACVINKLTIVVAQIELQTTQMENLEEVKDFEYKLTSEFEYNCIHSKCFKRQDGYETPPNCDPSQIKTQNVKIDLVMRNSKVIVERFICPSVTTNSKTEFLFKKQDDEDLNYIVHSIETQSILSIKDLQCKKYDLDINDLKEQSQAIISSYIVCQERLFYPVQENPRCQIPCQFKVKKTSSSVIIRVVEDEVLETNRFKFDSLEHIEKNHPNILAHVSGQEVHSINIQFIGNVNSKVLLLFPQNVVFSNFCILKNPFSIQVENPNYNPLHLTPSAQANLNSTVAYQIKIFTVIMNIISSGIGDLFLGFLVFQQIFQQFYANDINGGRIYTFMKQLSNDQLDTDLLVQKFPKYEYETVVEKIPEYTFMAIFDYIIFFHIVLHLFIKISYTHRIFMKIPHKYYLIKYEKKLRRVSQEFYMAIWNKNVVIFFNQIIPFILKFQITDIKGRLLMITYNTIISFYCVYNVMVFIFEIIEFSKIKQRIMNNQVLKINYRDKDNKLLMKIKFSQLIYFSAMFMWISQVNRILTIVVFCQIIQMINLRQVYLYSRKVKSTTIFRIMNVNFITNLCLFLWLTLLLFNNPLLDYCKDCLFVLSNALKIVEIFMLIKANRNFKHIRIEKLKQKGKDSILRNDF